MSKIFYDDLVDLETIEKKIKKIAKTSEEREELYGLVDEIVHHKVIGCILDQLPEQHHEEFLTAFSKRPHDQKLLDYLRERISVDIVDFIREEVHKLSVELLMYVEETSRPKKLKTSVGNK
jgi:hypothetical protein